MAPDNAPVTVIAGLACARALQDAGRDVEVLDRGRAPGGRLSSRTVRGRPVDLGASYLTAGDGSPFAAVVADWADRGLARPWTDTFAVIGPEGARERKSGPLRYGTPRGSRSLAADLATGLTVRTGTTVREVAAGPAVDGRAVPAAVLAMPGPQAARLLDPAGLPAGRAVRPGRRDRSLRGRLARTGEGRERVVLRHRARPRTRPLTGTMNSPSVEFITR